MTTLDDKILSLRPGARVDLYEIDLTSRNGGRLRLSPNREPILPQSVVRLRDTSEAAQVKYKNGMGTPVPNGSRILVEGYFRRISGTGFFEILIEDFDNPASYFRVRIHPTTLALSNGVVGGFGTAGASAAAIAGEYIYFCARVTLTGNRDVTLSVVPARGEQSAFPSVTNAAQATVDVAMFRAVRLVGGMAIPIPIPMDADLWLSGTTGQNAVDLSAPTAQLLKVPVWAGNAYTPIPIEVTGFEKSGTGAFPRPKMRMSNLFSEGSALAQEYGDLRGAVVTRRRVYADNLDNGANPDPMASFTPEIYSVTRMALQNSIITEWELASKMDQQGVKLPGRQLLRDVCPFVYRSWDGTKWVYAGENGCPYTGSAMFDENGDPVTQRENDKCSHLLGTGCRARFGTKAALPFGGFPMVDRF